ncbi:hypothetical protein GO497_21140 [Acidovorax citrulli]|nr:hypothetical protein [Paracidovorax citrulli]
MTDHEQNTIDDTMRILGQITRIVFKSERLPPNILMALLSKPSLGMGLLMKSSEAIRALDPNHKYHDARIARLVAKLPAELPSGPIGVEAQGPFWLGYYQTPRLAGETGRAGPARGRRGAVWRHLADGPC